MYTIITIIFSRSNEIQLSVLISQEFVTEFPDVVFLKVDVDDNEEIAMEYDISSMPTFVFIKSSEKVSKSSKRAFFVVLCHNF